MCFRIVGLTGSAGSGKDTVADILVGKHGFVKVSLADPLKKGISAMFGIPKDVLDSRVLKENPHPSLCGRSPRYVMQMLGTEFGRMLIAENVWTQIAYNTIKEHQDNDVVGVVIPDIRFESEAAWFRTISDDLWHIKRDNNPCQIFSSHASEKGIERLPNDALIINNYDRDTLENTVDALYSLVG